MSEDTILYARYKNNGKNNSDDRPVVTLLFTNDNRAETYAVPEPDSNNFETCTQSFSNGIPVEFYSLSITWGHDTINSLSSS